MILGIRTDKPESELWLASKSGELLEVFKWQAHRQLAETIHVQIKDLLGRHGQTLDGLSGIVSYLGPGSFTGLRIGLTVANALAYGLGLPIAGGKNEDWFGEACQNLPSESTGKFLSPDYGAPVHITTPKK